MDEWMNEWGGQRGREWVSELRDEGTNDERPNELTIEWYKTQTIEINRKIITLFNKFTKTNI